jgi:DNA-binding MarR family transcriptional regulator
MNVIELPEDQALVLQQVGEYGEEDFDELAETLRYDRGRLSQIVQALHHKGLVYFNRGAQRGSWIHLSSKGRKLMLYLWPDMSGFSPA